MKTIAYTFHDLDLYGYVASYKNSIELTESHFHKISSDSDTAGNCFAIDLSEIVQDFDDFRLLRVTLGVWK